MALKHKLARLKRIILKYDSCLVAFSGGVDSSLLLKVAASILPKEKVLAVTACSPAYPEEELLQACNIARFIGARHKVIKTNELKDAGFISNAPDRCYFCKKRLFTKLKGIAAKAKLNFVLEAGSLSDKSDFRPGNTAARELNIRSPLVEAGFNKQDIRRLSKELGLKTWDKPSFACLASRIPYGTRISPLLLKQVEEAERYLRKAGFKQARARHYGGLCRIEVNKKDIPRLVNKRKQIIDKLKKIGYNYITLDLEGYRTGSLNEVINR